VVALLTPILPIGRYFPVGDIAFGVPSGSLSGDTAQENVMKGTVALLLSVLGGYVDTAGFLALQGLFTAHVTGNFVTLAATLVSGTSGVLAKLLALPVFLAAVAIARVVGNVLGSRQALRFRTMMGLQLVLLIVGGFLAVRFGPFPDGDARPAIMTGLVLVCAMAVQNALHRAHLGGFPPSTLMTGNTTQAVFDMIDVVWPGNDRAATWVRLQRLVMSVAGFAVGCAAAALFFWLSAMWCFVVPPLLVVAALAIPRSDAPAD
jgi:uncharacterized membrane protein YoaK (UPF0700 family)